jgi:hypothetical protein
MKINQDKFDKNDKAFLTKESKYKGSLLEDY